MATRGRFIAGQPLSVSQLNEMNRVADSGKPRVLGSSVDIASGESGMAIQPTGTPATILRTLKVTGTVTGGYSFQEVYDPDGDGAYTDAKGYVSVGTSMFLVAKSGVTLAPNDIVVARLNPYNSSRWEWLATLATASAGSALSTSNTDGTQSGTTTDMRFDKASGIQITQGGGFDTVSIIAGSYTQNGSITTASQFLSGDKILKNTDKLGVSDYIGGTGYLYMGTWVAGGGGYGLNYFNQSFLIFKNNLVISVGDLEVYNDSQGLVLHSPDGNRWRVQVTNAGALTVTGPI